MLFARVIRISIAATSETAAAAAATHKIISIHMNRVIHTAAHGKKGRNELNIYLVCIENFVWIFICARAQSEPENGIVERRERSEDRTAARRFEI